MRGSAAGGRPPACRAPRALVKQGRVLVTYLPTLLMFVEAGARGGLASDLGGGLKVWVLFLGWREGAGSCDRMGSVEGGRNRGLGFVGVWMGGMDGMPCTCRAKMGVLEYCAHSSSRKLSKLCDRACRPDGRS